MLKSLSTFIIVKCNVINDEWNDVMQLKYNIIIYYL